MEEDLYFIIDENINHYIEEYFNEYPEYNNKHYYDDIIRSGSFIEFCEKRIMGDKK